MKRRQFITALGSAAVWPIAGRAQHAGPTIGFSGSSQSLWNDAFVQRLGELGWIEHRNITLEIRRADGLPERYAQIAAEFVRLPADIIVTSGTPMTLAALNATSVIPIVFVAAGDPVGAGLVASLARPGGHVTGLSNLTRDVASKRVQLLRDVVPVLERLGVLANFDNPASMLEMREVQTAGSTLGLAVLTPEIRRREHVTPAIESLNGRADALYVVIDPLVNANLRLINALALSGRLPTMHGSREFVAVDGLMSYGPNFPNLFRRAGDYVDKILRGAKPGEIPVEQPVRFDLVVNLKTAKALDVMVPPAVLARADEVIE
jgi:putative ABC transport system substrate-binding protein